MTRNIPTPDAQRETEVFVIGSLGAKGDGIAMTDAGPVYFPLTLPGERVRGRLDFSGMEGRGEAIEILVPGPDRVTPLCPHFGRCGGCQMQHIADGAYDAWKRRILRHALDQRGFERVAISPTVKVPPASRRRAIFSTRRIAGDALLGFKAYRTNRIVEIDSCAVLRPPLRDLLPALREAVARVKLDGAATIVLTELDDGIDMLVRAPAGLDLTARQVLAEFAASYDLARISWQGGQNPGHGHTTAAIEPIAHRRRGQIAFGGVAVSPSPGGFLQPTREGEAALARLVSAALAGAASVVDLFCGVGTFTLPLAAGTLPLAAGTLPLAVGRRIRAFDADPESIRSLTEASRRYDLAGRVVAQTRDLFRRPLDATEVEGADAVIFDPPRPGAQAQTKALAAAAVPLVVGVSCNPATFARDARILAQGGFHLQSVAPVDQFLWTPHLEIVGIFRR